MPKPLIMRTTDHLGNPRTIIYRDYKAPHAYRSTSPKPRRRMSSVIVKAALGGRI